MKGDIQPDHMPVNKYTLIVIGTLVPLFTAITVSGLDDELETTVLPDRTVATGGNRGASEFTMTIPAHHKLEVAAAEAWFQEAQDPVSPGYKKAGTLSFLSNEGTAQTSWSLVGMFITKRVTPEGEMENEGEMAVIEYTISVDDVLPLP